MKKTMFLLCAVLFLVSCNQNNVEIRNQSQEISNLKEKMEALKPGLGEIMGTIQQHHAKLYFSATNKNWKLAEYQLDEIKEGIEEATELHDHFKDIPGSLKEMSKITNEPLKNIETSIHNQNLQSFHVAFKELTQSCNACHQAANHDFIVIQEPTAQIFSNQKFSK